MLALWYVPTGLMVLTPGRAIGLLDRVEITPEDGAPAAVARPAEGDVLLLTAEVRSVNLYRAVVAVLGFPRGADLVAKTALIPYGMTDEEFVAYNRSLMEESVGLASAVAVRAAGGSVTARGGGVRVIAVPPGGGLAWFRPGDVIVALDGSDLSFSGDVARALAGRAAGEQVRATVRRDSAEHEVQVALTASVPGAGELKLGLVIATEDPHIETHPAVTVETESIGGPSGGLALALAVYARLSSEDLLNGRLVAASGSIRLDGSVGAVGGVAQKAVEARSAGVDVFLVPPANAAEARSSAPGLLVVEVATFDDAVRYLRAAR